MLEDLLDSLFEDNTDSNIGVETPDLMIDDELTNGQDVLGDGFVDVESSDNSNVSFMGEKDVDYFEKKKENALYQENWHLEKAKEALERGDESAYKDHMSRAKIWHSDAEKFERSIKLFKKK